MTEHEVVIAGGGPTGMMLAAELSLAGVEAVIVEKRDDQELIGSRALGLHSRTIEVLDQRGVADRFISEGQTYKVVHFHVALDISDFPTRHNYVLGLLQKHTERILAGWVSELKVPIYQGRAVTDFAQDDEGVDVELSDGKSLRAEYLVGCDGGRSVIRKSAGIEFAGWDPTTSWLIAEAELSEEPVWGFRQGTHGVNAIGKVPDRGPLYARMVLIEPEVGSGMEPTLSDISELLIAAYGTDYGIRSPTWISRFTDMTRQAVAYRDRRVVLAGDAAHVHAPIGGQGLNIGMQDAVNLGWKLAQVVKRISPDALLDTYHAERHPVAARALRNTMAQMPLRRTDERAKALGEYMAAFLAMDGPRRKMAGEMSGLDIHYDLGEGHPLLGRRMPDLDLDTSGGPRRVYSFLHQGKPLLLNLGAPGAVDRGPWADRVQLLEAKYGGIWELPVIGPVTAPTAVLIRPDGHVSWVGERTQEGLRDALSRWFGQDAG